MVHGFYIVGRNINASKLWKIIDTLLKYTHIYIFTKSLQVVTAAIKLEDIASWKKSYDKPRQVDHKEG